MSEACGPDYCSIPPALSDAAVQKLRDLLRPKGNPDLGLRLYVTAGGCSGFKYGMCWDVPDGDDYQIVYDDVRLIVDRRSATYLGGVEIDYRSQHGRGAFAISNPGASETCKCGRSFGVDNPSVLPDLRG